VLRGTAWKQAESAQRGSYPSTKRRRGGSACEGLYDIPSKTAPPQVTPLITFCFAIPDDAAMRYPLRQEWNMSAERFFGGSPGAVIVKLVIASIMIGVVLSAFGYNPNNLYDAILRLGEWIRSLGLDAVNKVLRYLVLGAIIVVPLWFFSRVFSLFGPRRGKERE
jgi:hypothetical protein